MHTHTNTHTHKHKPIHAHNHIQAYMYSHKCMHKHNHMHTYIPLNAHTQISELELPKKLLFMLPTTKGISSMGSRERTVSDVCSQASRMERLRVLAQQSYFSKCWLMTTSCQASLGILLGRGLELDLQEKFSLRGFSMSFLV